MNVSTEGTRSFTPCPLCGSAGPAWMFDSHNGYPIVRCSQCRLVYLPESGEPAPEQLYPTFDQTKASWLDGVRRALSVFLRQREAFVRSVRPPPARLLDFGCGAGAFARWMSEHGYDVVGLEPYSFGGEVTHGDRLRFVRAPLEDARPTLGKFDVITMWHVLEHVRNPVDLLRSLVGLLAPGGVVIVSVPNFESMQSRLFRGGWFHLDPPRHVLQFEPATLSECLRRAGLASFREQPFLPEYGTSGWVQSTLNRMLPHYNYLYELVKDRGALREMPPGSAAMHLAVSLAAAPPILAASMALEAAASRTNQCAALTVAARPLG
jgi:SAM-dependent methyltransferase